jgi:Phage integrase family
VNAVELGYRRRCLIQFGSVAYKPLHFHSFRRAFATSLASCGMNVQQAMALAGHRNPSTHMRYVRITEVLEIPAAAFPKLKAEGVPFALRPASQPSIFSAHPVGFEPTTLGFEVRCSIQLS